MHCNGHSGIRELIVCESSVAGHAGNGAQQPREPSQGAQLRLQHEDLSRVNLLFVLDPNFFLCW